MTRRHLILLSSILFSGGCKAFLNNDGAPCGGTRQVDAIAMLPDTGLGAGGRANISFTESEPSGSRDDATLFVWTFPPANTMFANSPPRVRLVTDDGRVFVDVQSTLATSGSWYVIQAIPSGAIRDQIISSFKAGAVMVEFSSSAPNQKLTRVRPEVRFAGTLPVMRCV